jgi:hypothetical protein
LRPGVIWADDLSYESCIDFDKSHAAFFEKIRINDTFLLFCGTLVSVILYKGVFYEPRKNSGIR